MASSRRIEFPTSDVVELERLSSACQPATFGNNKDHVLDENYRRARKMDVEDFAINMGFNFTDFLNHAVRRLLGAPHDDKNFRAELYKLNVYGPGSFFKPHRDTPRADDMFGSLIVALPTKHEGGSLILRDEKNELVFESSQKCTSSESGLYSVPWAAFWSQIEHEVAPVISGYRVTLTFNLYFSKVPLPTSVRVSNVVPDASPLFTILKTLLNDSTFLPQGGLLGFGLEHQYPMSNTSKLQSLMMYLKGTDSFIVMTAQALGLKAYLRTVYDIAASDQIGFQSDDEGYSYRPGPVEEVCQRRWLMKCKVMYLEYFYDYNSDQDDTLGEWMRESLEKGDTFFVNRGFLNRSGQCSSQLFLSSDGR
ncbi:hypothetical protein SISNIDRAFT_446096 [Sistotremastrum niveocremeum HHB9708]|uniref:Fe2OG dioxygenase domain-containing protein n=1 Tax=Sistotremastrum niveocremeum HHB9708 TaxID=1314777 RepID=A0A164P1V3_9AGAM|nr:hypothetical protein SISNIDRAFT_446096 [Sistotremastrum niveocremeum HHB9708]